MSFGSKPLLNYSKSDGRATLLDSESLMPPKRKRSTKRASSKASRGVRIVKGRVALRVAGYSGVQRLAPSHLIKFVPLSKIRIAAKRVLSTTKVKSVKKKGRRSGKRRVGRRRRKL